MSAPNASVTPTRRIGVLTGGGDAPGLNAVIRAVVRAATKADIECVGLQDSFDGLICARLRAPPSPPRP
jgi:6-phosphofructokinase 1